ncbi:MAG TPA: response regulator transcription factor [Symbiobacteriaceae bacterium]|nr:response regulator transcription factor [Symbiobacteriaceae bacterium]
MPIRIALVDDHSVLRQGLRLLLETQPDLAVVGEAEDAEEGLALVRQVQPDLLLLDLSLPGMSGLELLKLVLAQAPALKVIVLTMHDDAEFVRSALMAGAFGYMLKRAVGNELLEAIRKVAAGETYVYPSLAAKLIGTGPPPAPEQTGTRLSARETEVLQLIAQGYTQGEIAERLCVSVKTVETHRARIAEKLGLRTRVQLVRYALEKNLVQKD